jgi:hypothetical protein
MKRMTTVLVMFSAVGIAACQNANNEQAASEQMPAASEPAETMPQENAPAAQPQAQEPQTTTEQSLMTEPQWVTLFGGKDLSAFTKVGDANWMITDGYVEADSGTGFLVTPGSYTNFRIQVEFWTSPDANSGVFLRCDNTDDISADTCYEVNIFDQRPDQAYRTGAIVGVAEPTAQIDAANQWNTYDITAEGSHLTVTLNGTQTVDVENDQHMSGPIALQYSAGTVRFRSVKLRPL